MTEVPASTPSILHKVSDGRLGLAASVFDLRFWKEEVAANGAFALVLAGVLFAAFVAALTNGGPTAWGLSAQALAEGRWWTIGSHMMAHAGIGHLLMNIGGLLPLGAIISLRFGSGIDAWFRQGLLFTLTGLAGAALFLLLNPQGTVPMVGASGAICGLWGAVARIGPTGEIVPLRSGQVWKDVKAFAKINLLLFAILFGLARLSGGAGGLAWEAHLGGFVLGLLVMPFLVPPVPPNFTRSLTPPAAEKNE